VDNRAFGFKKKKLLKKERDFHSDQSKFEESYYNESETSIEKDRTEKLSGPQRKFIYKFLTLKQVINHASRLTHADRDDWTPYMWYDDVTRIIKFNSYYYN